MKPFLNFLLFYLPLLCFSQGEQNIWYFSDEAGLDFNGGAPVALTDGQTLSFIGEGVASISDAAGNILFYTNGNKVWNRLHNVMPNGTALEGGTSSTQSSLIVPHPGNPNQYFLFTTAQEGGKSPGYTGFAYNIIDMSLAGGNGNVLVKNFHLGPDTSTEAQTAVPHCNGTDFWIITHQHNSTNFFVYLLTTTGLITTPIIQSVGTYVAFSRSDGFNLPPWGAMKASPDGTKLAMCIKGNAGTGLNGLIELFDFDNSTGIISNPVPDNANLSTPYGIEFSPDGSKLYASYMGDQSLKQFNLNAGSPAAIIASRTTILAGGSDKNFLQLAPDNKIYVAKFNEGTLGVINNPNALGAACNYVDAGLALAGQTCHRGLPNFYKVLAPSSITPPTITANDTCLGALTSFTLSNTSGITSASWDFDDGSALDNNINPTHTFANPGTYNVEVTLDYGCSTEIVKYTITIVSCSNILSGTVNGTNSSCAGKNDGIATASGINGQPNYTYNWMPGNITGSTISSLSPGTYTVTITDANNATYIDSVIITEPDSLKIDPISDVTICSGDAATLNASVNGGTPTYTYNWNSGAGTSSSYNDSPLSDTKYTLEVSDQNSCADTISVYVFVVTQIIAEAGNNAIICQNDSTSLMASGGNNYQWLPTNGLSNPNIANPMASPSVTTTYTVSVSSGTCAPDIDSLTVFVLPAINAYAGKDTNICEGETAILNASGGDDYLWNTNAGTQSISVSPAVSTNYTVYVSSGSCLPDSDMVRVNIFPKPLADAGAAVKIEAGENITLNGTGAGTFSWSPAANLDDPLSQNPIATPVQTTTYTLTITDINGCTSEDTVTIFVAELCDTDPIFIPTAFSPNGDGINDKFIVRGICIDKLNLIIYDRWGEKVFETNDKNKGWDGIYQNHFLNTAVFDYFLNATLINGEQITLQGNVNLIR